MILLGDRKEEYDLDTFHMAYVNEPSGNISFRTYLHPVFRLRH